MIDILYLPNQRAGSEVARYEGLLRTFNLVGLERTPDSHNGSMRERKREIHRHSACD